MSVIAAISGLPIIVQIVGGIIAVVFILSALLLLAVRLRILIAIGAAAATAYGQWNAADPSVALPLIIGCAVWFALRVLDASDEAPGDDDGVLEQPGSPSAGGFDYRAEANRIEADYHRRQREGRF